MSILKKKADNLHRVVLYALGDFEEIYGQDAPEDEDENEPQSGLWDGVLTCFFLDTVRCSLFSLCLQHFSMILPFYVHPPTGLSLSFFTFHLCNHTHRLI
jgi:hypothetical protein